MQYNAQEASGLKIVTKTIWPMPAGVGSAVNIEYFVWEQVYEVIDQ